MATMTFRIGSKRSSFNGIINREHKEMCTVAVARSHIDRASKYHSVYDNTSHIVLN
jgi:hypothetical protein